MTQSTFGTPKTVPDDLPGVESEGPDRRRLLVFGLGGLLLALLAVGLFLVLSGSGSNNTTAASSLAKANAAPVNSGASAQTVPQQIAPAPVIGRDPFAGLPASGTAAAAAAASTTSGGTTASTTTPAHTLVLVAVSAPTQSAVFTVDGKKVTAKTGTTFAPNFRLYSLFGTTCAGVLYGDQNIAICQGDVKKVGG